MSHDTDKPRLRAEMRRLRAAVADRAERSRIICQRTRQWLAAWATDLTARPSVQRRRLHAAACFTNAAASHAISDETVAHAGDAIESPRIVACYVGVRTEVATEPLLRWLLDREDFVLAVPRTLPDGLAMYRVERLSELAPGRFGIPEPVDEVLRQPERRIAPARLAAVLVPGLAFDQRGFRLGYGGGFFDRLLSEIPPHAPAIGLAFDCQIIAACPVEPHDVAVDLLITETRVIDCRHPAES